MRKIFLSVLLLACFCAGYSQDSIWLARTTGQLPFMEYGIGDDRLGGAKMGFLDSNVLVRVVDSNGTDYKVRLSSQHYAYIAKTSVVRQGKASARLPAHNPHLSGSIRVFGDTASDYVLVSLDDRLPYRGMQLLDPSRVAVDIFGVTSNTNWITQISNTQEIKNAWYEQPEDDVMRVIIELNHQQHWGYSIYYTGNKLTIRVKRQPAILALQNLTIAVDAGHGGDNMGATGVTTNIMEKEYTLLIAKELQAALLRKKANVIMTREKDTSLTMPQRIQFLREKNPDLLISVHLNSSSLDTTSGVSTYYRYIGFRPLTVAILHRMEELGLKEYGNVVHLISA